MRSAYFVTSTGTGVGKTYVAAAMIRQARAAGKQVVALKPLISGFQEEQLAQTDTGVLIDALGLPPNSAEIDRISPWRYLAPLAPSVAARREGRETSLEELVAFSRKAELSDAEVVLIEGVGGVMAPINDRHTVLDWIEKLEMPALLVVGSYLGAVSHTLTALEAMGKRGVRIGAIIVNESPDPSLTLLETIDEFRNRSCGAPVIGFARRSDGRELIPLLQGTAL